MLVGLLVCGSRFKYFNVKMLEVSMKCVHCDRGIEGEQDVYCHDCYTSLSDEHDKVRAVHSSLGDLEDLHRDLDEWGSATLYIPAEEIGGLADRLRKIIDDNKEAWGL